MSLGPGFDSRRLHSLKPPGAIPGASVSRAGWAPRLISDVTDAPSSRRAGSGQGPRLGRTGGGVRPSERTNGGPPAVNSKHLLCNPPRPDGLAYATPSETYTAGVPIAPNVPTWIGTATAFSVTPALPDGLVLDPATGVLHGIPAAPTPAAGYAVTATGPTGKPAREMRRPGCLGSDPGGFVVFAPSRPVTSDVRNGADPPQTERAVDCG